MNARELKDSISRVEMDASNLRLDEEDMKQIVLHLKEAKDSLASAESDAHGRENDLRDGFASLGKARGILGKSAVQPASFRRHQWPFLPPEDNTSK